MSKRFILRYVIYIKIGFLTFLFQKMLIYSGVNKIKKDALSGDQNIVIEEKISKVNGEITIKVNYQ